MTLTAFTLIPNNVWGKESTTVLTVSMRLCQASDLVSCVFVFRCMYAVMVCISNEPWFWFSCIKLSVRWVLTKLHKVHARWIIWTLLEITSDKKPICQDDTSFSDKNHRWKVKIIARILFLTWIRRKTFTTTASLPVSRFSHIYGFWHSFVREWFSMWREFYEF